MQTLKPIFGVIRALVPIGYCFYLLYYFLDVSGSVEEAKSNGLGPTLLGLAIVGLLFSIPLMVKIFRLFARPRSPGSGGHGGLGGSDDEESGFDADAAVARYMARRSAEAAAESPAQPVARGAGTPSNRPTFGRKTR